MSPSVLLCFAVFCSVLSCPVHCRLKTLMHSMSMSMVRERSVSSFLGRIQTRKFNEDAPYSGGDTASLPPPKSAVGWHELRKVIVDLLCSYCFLSVADHECCMW